MFKIGSLDSSAICILRSFYWTKITLRIVSAAVAFRNSKPVYIKYPIHRSASRNATPPPSIGRMKSEINPMFRRGNIAEGIESFFELIELAETIKELGWSPSSTDALESWLPFAHDQPFALEWCPSESDVRRLTHPTLVLEGDRTTPLLRDICRLVTEKLPNSRLTTMTGCDHLAPVLRPMLVAEKISEFIARATPSN